MICDSGLKCLICIAQHGVFLFVLDWENAIWLYPARGVSVRSRQLLLILSLKTRFVDYFPRITQSITGINKKAWQFISMVYKIYTTTYLNLRDFVFFSAREQIQQSDWFLERAEFSDTERYSGRNPSSWSIFVHELAIIVNLSPFFTLP